MSIELITVLFFGSLFLLLATGLPLAFALGGLAVVFTLWLWGVPGLFLTAAKAMGMMSTIILIAAPLFIFMANVLERSGVAEALFTMIYRWGGRLPGSLAIGVVVICTIFAAMSGASATGTVTMGIIALPAMLKRGYDKRLGIGCIMAGGALGPLIPPSVTMIVFGLFYGVSIGKLFAGGIVPGLILASLFIAYIAVRSYFQPHLAPPLPPEELASWREKLVSTRAVILPLLLVVAVLGSIFGGLATPTEASAVGAFGSLAAAAVNGKLNWTLIKEASYRTLTITAMILWIIMAASMFTAVYQGIGAADLVRNLLENWSVSPLVILIVIQLSFFVLGCLMDPVGILLITTPVYLPLLPLLGIDPLWFGILFMVNTEMAYLTPPFGVNLFYMRGIVPKNVSMVDIYLSAVPFVLLQAVGLALVIVFPELATWLPNLLFPGPR